MALYELRTYTLYAGKMAEAANLYQEFGYPALQKGGQDRKLVGYFQSDTGTINQLVHMWKFDDDSDRRRHCQSGAAARRGRPHRVWRCVLFHDVQRQQAVDHGQPEIRAWPRAGQGDGEEGRCLHRELRAWRGRAIGAWL